MGLLLAFGAASLALLGPLAPEPARSSARTASAATDVVRHSSRRQLLTGAAAALGGLAALPAPSMASYALYQSSYDSFQDRKATGYVPVATNDRATLAEIQQDIRRKRPLPTNKPEKAPQYCAGQTASVTPMLENICSNIGASKADQSNSMTDAFGNMNVGSYTSMTGAERAAADARLARATQAAEAARLRASVRRQ